MYDLKERLYHSQYKMFYPAELPTYIGEQYGKDFPVFAGVPNHNISVHDIYSNKLMDYYFKVEGGWVHVTRAADIASRPAPRDFFAHDFQTCHTNSRRNLGRQGSPIIHAIEYGSYYHQIVPRPGTRWSKKSLTPWMHAEAQVHPDNGLCR